MSNIRADFVYESGTGSGTGPITLTGAIPGGFKTFDSVMSDGQTADATIMDVASGVKEVSTCILHVVLGVKTLERITWRSSTVGSALVNFSAGAKICWMSVPAHALVTTDGFKMLGAIDWATAVTVNAAITPDLFAAASNILVLNGAATIAGFASYPAGAVRVVKHTGGHQLTHHATSMILRGKASIVTRTDDVSVFHSLGSGNTEQLLFQRADGLPLSLSEVRAEVHSFVQAG